MLLVAPSVRGRDRLAMQVSPPITVEPAYVTVRITVETDAQNRTLEVVADAPDFYRSSQIPLEGERAPRTSVFEFRDLPNGTYEVRGILGGLKGPRATATRPLVVLPSPGGSGGRASKVGRVTPKRLPPKRP